MQQPANAASGGGETGLSRLVPKLGPDRAATTGSADCVSRDAPYKLNYFSIDLPRYRASLQTWL